MSLKILTVVPKADDATSFYRAYGPLADLRKHFDVTYMMPSSYSWATMAINDIVFMQRPADPNCLNIAAQAKMAGVPLWIDFDDDNLSVPKDNETSAFFGQWNVKDTIIKCARMADVITVSTEFLRKKYSVYNKNVVLVPNAVDDRYIHVRTNVIPKRAKDKVIAWRGGPGFHKNIEMVYESIVELANKNDKWKFIFMGNEPYEITNKIKNYQFIPWQDFMNYLQIGCQIHASSFFYCVTPNDHSLSRSHGPWLEASFFGSAMLSKKTPEMERPGCLNFETPQEFHEKLGAIMNKEVDVDKLANESWEYICDNYLLSKVNLKRKEVIEKLLGGKA